MNKIIKGDQVVVIAGKDKGKQGQVVRVLGDKVVVEGVNLVKKHQRPTNELPQGGIIEKEAAIHVSNVQGYRICLQRFWGMRRKR